MYINLGRFLSSALLPLIFFCEYWRLFPHLFTWSFDYIVAFVPGFYDFVWIFYVGSIISAYMHSPQWGDTFGTYLEYKENGAWCVKKQLGAKHTHEKQCIHFSLCSKWCFCLDVLTAERSGHFCHHCRFLFSRIFTLWLLFLNNYLWFKLYWVWAHPLPVGTVATINAEASVRSFCCHNCALCLLAYISWLSY